MNWLSRFPRQLEVFFLSPEMPDFEQAYTAVREIEGRLLPDDLVRRLPDMPAGHPLQAEWNQRKPGSERLLHFFQKQKLPLHILDLGCGNGWFTHQLAHETHHQVLGLDVNRLELEQAARLFSSENCRFAYADVFAAELPAAAFDLVVCNASVQYFPDLSALVGRLSAITRPAATLHVLDSPFYPQAALAAARERTIAYYREKGAPGMADFYFHHSVEAVESLGGKFLYRPKPLINRVWKQVGFPQSPFPWLQIPV